MSSKSPKAPKPARLTAEQLQAIAHAIADPRRFAILQQIASQDELPCTDLHARGLLAPATISHHIKVLSEAGLLHLAREGRGMRLSLDRETWTAYVHQLAQLPTRSSQRS